MAHDHNFNKREIEKEIKAAAAEFGPVGLWIIWENLVQTNEEAENEMMNGRAGLLGAILWLKKTVDSNMFSDEGCKVYVETICQYLLYRGAR